MSSEPQQVKEAREAIASLLGRLQPTPTAAWIEERTKQIMLQFGSRASDDPPPKRPV